MAEILTVPFGAAALVLCVAGVAKLRSPRGAVQALRTLGLRAWPVLIRGLGALEIALGAWCLASPGTASAAVAACAFAVFALAARTLAARRASCGCFGDSDLPASAAQVLVSASLGAVCAGAAARAPHGIEWMLGRPPGLACALVLALAGCAYALVLAYTLLPSAWAAWSPSR